MTTQINNSQDLLGYLIEKQSGNKAWFGFKEQKVTGISLIHAIAANHANTMTPDEVVAYVMSLNDQIYHKMIKEA